MGELLDKFPSDKRLLHRADFRCNARLNVYTKLNQLGSSEFFVYGCPETLIFPMVFNLCSTLTGISNRCHG